MINHHQDLTETELICHFYAISPINASCRKSRADAGSSPNSSAVSQVVLPMHWEVSQTRASATNFSIGSNSVVQRSGMSMTSVGTHLGSNTGMGLVSATYSPLSHQGSLLRKDVDNQKNLRQADLNAVKRTPLSLKVRAVNMQRGMLNS